MRGVHCAINWRLRRGETGFVKMESLLASRTTLVLVASASALALTAAFIGQYVFDLPPCDLCIYQRYPYVIAIALCLVTLMPATRPFAAWALILSALILSINSGIAAYHVGVEQHWWIGPEGCTGPGGTPQTLDALRAQIAATPVIRCDDIAFSLFGISMAGYNVLFSLALAIYTASVSKAALRV